MSGVLNLNAIGWITEDPWQPKYQGGEVELVIG